MAGEQALFLFFMRQMLLFFFSRMYLRRRALRRRRVGRRRERYHEIQHGQQFLQSLQSFKLKAGSIGQCGNVTVRAIAHFCHGQLRQEVLANAVRTISRVYTRRGGILTPRWAIVHDRTSAFENQTCSWQRCSRYRSSHLRMDEKREKKKKKREQALRQAALQGDTVRVKQLLKKGVNPNGNADHWDRPPDPLHLAAYYGHHETVSVLLTAGADVNARDRLVHTPLHWAARNGHHETVSALLAAGADVNTWDMWHSTPLHVAAWNGHLETVSVLLAAGVDVIDPLDVVQSTPLHWAAQNGHHETVSALLAAGADVNTQNCGRWTPLHLAAMNGHHETVSVLLAAGADVNTRDDWDKTALHLAAVNGHHETVSVLLAAGVRLRYYIDRESSNGKNTHSCINTGMPADGGYTPLQYATLRGQSRGVEVLQQYRADRDDRNKDFTSKNHKSKKHKQRPSATDSVVAKLKLPCNWRELGRNLGLSVADLDRIGQKHQDDTMIMRCCLVLEWQHHTDTEGLESAVVLDTAGQRAIVDRLNTSEQSRELLDLQDQVTSILRADFPNLNFVPDKDKKADEDRQELNRKTLREEMFSNSGDEAERIDSLPLLGRSIPESEDDRKMVVVVGHPHGGSKKVDFCPIAGVVEKYAIHVRSPNLIQADTRKPLYHTGVMFHGSSGSPGFDMYGNVVLMHTRGFPEGRSKSRIECGVLLTAIKDHARQTLQPENFTNFSKLSVLKCAVNRKERFYGGFMPFFGCLREKNPVVNCELRWLLTEPDKRRLDQSRPGDQMNTSSGDSCLNLTTVDWTRPGDLKTQEEYQTDWSRPDDLKTREEYQQQCLRDFVEWIGLGFREWLAFYRRVDRRPLESYKFWLVDQRGVNTTLHCSGDSCLNLTTVDWTRPGDLKTQEEYQLTAVMILNPTRPDVRVLRNLVTGNFSPVHTSKSDNLKTMTLWMIRRLDCSRMKDQTFVSRAQPVWKKMGRCDFTEVWSFFLLQSGLRIIHKVILKTEKQELLC
ncbi:hypothetical protein Bbelb_151770 [Branchiostoma belcheri]|nr:hypothetical protein Bbelb_151770 [Branchiostoma belcheri]